MLDRITPIVLTFNEMPNILRTLERLSWARRIVVVDSNSDDGTWDLLADQPRVSVYRRPFDCLANQWNFAFRETEIDTPWVLSLDADYQLTDTLVEEMTRLDPGAEGVSGYVISFLYCVFGKPLRGTLYPPSSYLFDLGKVHCIQDGHAHRFIVDGRVRRLAGKIRHDDRKPLSRWLRSQDGYMQIEKDLIRGTPWRELSWSDRVRKMRVLSPFLIFFYVLLVKGVILDGRAGLYYALQRLLAEALLMVYILEDDLLGCRPGAASD